MSENKKRKKKSFKKLLKHKTFRLRNIISLISVIISIIFVVFLGIMNVLPLKYYLLIIIGLLLVDIIGIIFINVHRKVILKLIGSIILIVSIIGSSVGLYFLSSTNNFLNNSFSNRSSYDKNTYYVVALKSNNLKQDDINGEISTYKETIYLDKAIEKLNKKYSVSEKSYEDIGLMVDSIYNNTDKFMLVEKSSYEIVLSISDKYKKDDFTILYEFDLYTKKKKNSNSNEEKFNIYIGGTDFAGLRDFNMIVSVNMKTHKALLTSIPRDYYIEVVGKNGRYDKLSFMSAYGPDTNKESLEKLFNIKIDYSVLVDTTSLVDVVDYVGGIEFCSDYEFTSSHALVKDTYNDAGSKLHVIKGCQHLDGIETLTVARERNAFPGRDRVRQENCSKIMIAIFK